MFDSMLLCQRVFGPAKYFAAALVVAAPAILAAVNLGGPGASVPHLLPILAGVGSVSESITPA